MSKPVVVTVPHRLGREEAVRRLKSGFERAGSQFAGILSISQQDWQGDRLIILGQEVTFRRRRFVCATQGLVQGKMAFEATIIGMPMVVT